MSEDQAPLLRVVKGEPSPEELAAHTVVGISIAVLLAIHIAAAIYHQAIRRDGTLLRIV